MIVLRLTPLQRRVLISVLVDWVRVDGTREWIDMVTDAKVTWDELMTLVSAAEEEASEPVLEKALELCTQFSNDWIAEGPSGPDSVWANKTSADWIKQAKEAK